MNKVQQQAEQLAQPGDVHSHLRPLVGVVMGSLSDWETMRNAVAILRDFSVPYEARVLSAHRMPDEMFDYAQIARARGLRSIIAGAGAAAHLPGMLASKTTIPVLGVPVASKYMRGIDSLYSIVQMPRGVPVATFAIGAAGAANAALFAIALLSSTYNINAQVNAEDFASKLEMFRVHQNNDARDIVLPPD
ncbi:5-(carboxyamino)imidazole ribonucleotide mutase [Candidatus Vallotia tarda]|uniref:N5-carboxyaminoimidazole ribonucleotide mutase n=1 Tax=Candidatus Vallotiella hemipterorum TaxID=1177213 RepID=A0A916JTP4_9BURK|nr:5-(carboxyamino)imidazole ribonucleotide mutase [Candidatus Vallotia tarda]CAG7597424.1 5-(carboxyamino)imidazole ribonucleotide mutase [Candidatus Vallotia tarda]